MFQKQQFSKKVARSSMYAFTNHKYLRIPFMLTLFFLALQISLFAQQTEKRIVPSNEEQYKIHLRSRQFTPKRAIDPETIKAMQSNMKKILADPLRAKVGKIHAILQLDRIPTRKEREAIKQHGVHLLNYVPKNAWIVAISGDVAEVVSKLKPYGLRWIGMLTPEDKLSVAIRENRFEKYSLMPDNRVHVLVQFHRTVSLDIAEEIVKNHGGNVKNKIKTINSLVVIMPKANINALASEDAVLWVEQAPAPIDITNDGARNAANVNIIQAAPYNLDGSGVRVLVFDVGLVDDNHPDLGVRVTHGEANVNWDGTIIDVMDHSTHVAGILGGDGVLSTTVGGAPAQWRGMAPAVNIVSYGVDWDGTGIFLYSNLTDLEDNFNDAINIHNVDIANASVGTNVASNGFNCSMEGDYHATSQLIDNIVRGSLGRPLITTWAAGNERGDGGCGVQYNTINPPANAKNPIHVGAVNSNDNSMTNFSGWGPTDDGRIKPVVVAPGCESVGDDGITSTIPNLFFNRRARNCAPGVPGPGPNTDRDDYCYPYDVMFGTSMAAPVVAGVAALMLQQYRDTYNTEEAPLPSTIKAILIHTADDLGNPGPDFRFGYGLVNAQAAVDLIRSQEPLIIESQINEDDEQEIFSIEVPAGQAELNVTLAWDDVAGLILAVKELQNNLDLSLESPDGDIFLPWILDPSAGHEGDRATPGVDDLNNMEQIHVVNPVNGIWKIRVTGEEVPEPIQKYSLVSDFPLYREDNVSVVQVIDRTGSMDHKDTPSGPTYMDSAKTAAQNFIGLMQLGDEVGVVAFDDEGCDDIGTKAEARFNLAEMTTETVRNNAITAIDPLYYRGCTSIGAGMQLAQEGPNFLDTATADQPHAMVLLTDGFENRSPWVNNILPTIPGETDIYTIALGPHADSDLMKDIANTTGGKFYESPTILGLLSIYYQIQGDLQLGEMADLETGTQSGGNETRIVTIDSGTSEATFVVGWLQKDGDLKLTLKDPNEITITPNTQNVKEGHGSTYYFLRIKAPLPGDWEVHILRTDSGDFQIDYTFATFVKGVSKLWSFIPDLTWAGDCLMTKVKLYDNRTLNPITGASVQAIISSPQAYKYTLNYNYVKPTATMKWNPQSIFSPHLKLAQAAMEIRRGDQLPTWSSTLRYYDQKSLSETGKSIFQYDSTTVTLYDDGTHGDEQAGDGTYTNCIDKTQIAGSYSIRFSISGVTTSGENFKRKMLSTATIKPGKVDAAKTLVRVDPSVIDVPEGSEGIITIVPMDGFGNVWGPGFATKISVTTKAGALSGAIMDNGDGFYFQTIKSTGVEGIGRITVTIDGVEMDTKPVVTFTALIYPFSVSVHSGAAIPRGSFANDFDRDLNILLDVDYHFTPQLSLVGIFGYNKFKSKSATIDDTYWINLSANIKYRLRTGTLSPYICGGPGYYIPETGSNAFGANLGIGVNYDFSSHLTLEVGLDYHKVFERDVQFLHTHAGVIFRF